METLRDLDPVDHPHYIMAGTPSPGVWRAPTSSAGNSAATALEFSEFDVVVSPPSAASSRFDAASVGSTWFPRGIVGGARPFEPDGSTRFAAELDTNLKASATIHRHCRVGSALARSPADGNDEESTLSVGRWVGCGATILTWCWNRVQATRGDEFKRIQRDTEEC